MSMAGPIPRPVVADGALAEEALGHLIHGLVVGCHQVRVSGNLQAGVSAPRARGLRSLRRDLRVHDHAVTNHGDGVVAQNTGGQQLQLKLLAVHHHG